MIEGVKLHDLKFFEDERGSVHHMLKRTDPHFLGFGEIYFSTINPGVVKAWHLHTRMTLNYAVVVGEIMVGLIDLRVTSKTFGMTEEIYLADPDGVKYQLLTIPPNVWNGFRSYRGHRRISIVANCATLPHDPNEIERIHPNDMPIPFDWGPYELAG